jgi:Pyruvate/2-oxoacid:ferredoxin oxidoreductase gamma subunit
MKGISENTTLVLNSNHEMEFPPEFKCKKFWVDATQIAIDLELRIAESYITNTIMTGAVAKATGLVKLESVLEAIKGQLSKRIWDKNLKAAERGYNETHLYGNGGK